MSDVTTVGIDLAKNVFSVHGVDAGGVWCCGEASPRRSCCELIAQLPPCLIGMEACSGAHDWARQFAELWAPGAADGAEVRGALSQERQERRQRRRGDLRGGQPPQHALCAGEEPSSSRRCCACIGRDRVSSRSARRRSTACGDCSPSSATCSRSVPVEVRRQAAARCSSNYRAGRRLHRRSPRHTCAMLEEQIAAYEREIEAHARSVPHAQRIQARAGIGPITASALVASVGDAQGILETAASSPPGSGSCRGSTRPAARPGSDTSRGAATAICACCSSWVHAPCCNPRPRDTRSRCRAGPRAARRRGYHRACVAIAAKNARMLWALLAARRRRTVRLT